MHKFYILIVFFLNKTLVRSIIGYFCSFREVSVNDVNLLKCMVTIQLTTSIIIFRPYIY